MSHSPSRHSRWLLALLPLPLLLLSCKKTQPPPPPTPLVQTSQSRSAAIPIYREFIGQIEGAQNANITARVSGYLISREYEEGSIVQAGQVLYRIDPRPYEAALSAAKAQLAQAEAKAQLAYNTLERQTELFKTNAISAQEFDAATQNSQAANSDVLAAQAAVQNAKLNLEFCTIRAPFEGLIGQSRAQIGELVGPADPKPLTTLSQINPVKVTFSLSEQEYLLAHDRIRAAEALPLTQRPHDFQIILSNGQIYPHSGVFAFLDRQVEPLTGTIRIVSYFPNPDALLRPGQFAKVKVLVKTLENAVLVPQRAVLEIQGTFYQIAVINSDNKVEFRSVHVGPRFGTEWVIADGLQAGETVVVEGIVKLRNGMTVRAIPWNPSPPPSNPTPSPPSPSAAFPSTSPATNPSPTGDGSPTPSSSPPLPQSSVSDQTPPSPSPSPAPSSQQP